MKKKLLTALLGVVFTLLLLEIALRVLGFGFHSGQDQRNRQSLKRLDTYRILCLGDSITGGGNMYSYPRQLEEILNARGGDKTFSVINKGEMGSDTSITLAHLDDNLDKYRPQVVVAMMGANDAGGALPNYGVPVAEQVGGLYSLRTYKLFKLLLLNLSMERSRQARQEKPSNKKKKGAEQEKEPPKDEDSFDPSRYPEELREFHLLIHRARRLKWQGDEDEAIKLFQSARRLHPNHPRAYTELAVLNLERARTLDDSGAPAEAKPFFDRAWPFLKKAIALDPLNITALEELANMHQRRGEPQRAEQVLREGIRGMKDRVPLLTVLGEILLKQKKYPEAEEVFREAIQRTPHNSHLYLNISFCLNRQGREEESRAMLQKAMDVLPKSGGADHVTLFVRLARYYERLGLRDEIVNLFEGAIKRYPKDDVILARLALYYEKWGDKQRSSRLQQRVDRLRRGQQNPMTRKNYRALRDRLKERGIRLVATQYPRRPLALLKQLLADDRQGVLFVDNEENFEQALKTARYETIFSDHCYGDSGHGTREGNRLIAASIARVLLKELR